mmetsp:Transcript_13094/g.50038  ORF Transcript_13094/g.50038 Transcript_13094/m.50038 type:complete len:333 (-) Transcript_13094:210-1208(-)
MEHTSPGRSAQLPENAKAGKSSPRHAHEGSDACTEQQPSQRPVGAVRGMGYKACRRLKPSCCGEQAGTNVAQRATKRCRCESTGAARGMSLAATRIGAKDWARGSQRLDGDSVLKRCRSSRGPGWYRRRERRHAHAKEHAYNHSGRRSSCASAECCLGLLAHCQIQRRLTVRVELKAVAPVGQQQLHDVQVPPGSRQVQRRARVPVQHRGAGSPLEQEPHAALVAGVGRARKRRRACKAAGLKVRACLDQVAAHIGVPRPACEVDGVVPCLGGSSNIAAGGNQRAHHLVVALEARKVDRTQAPSTRSIEVGAVFRQELHDLKVAVARSPGQG